MGITKTGLQLIALLVAAMTMATPVMSRPTEARTTGSLQDCNVTWVVTCHSLVSGSMTVNASTVTSTTPVTLAPDRDEGFIKTKAKDTKNDLNTMVPKYLEKHGNSTVTYWPFGEAHWSNSMDLETQSGAAQLLRLLGTYVRLWKVYDCSCKYEAHDFELNSTTTRTRDNIYNKLVVITHKVCQHVQTSVADGDMPSYDAIVKNMRDKMTTEATTQATRGNFIIKLRDFMNHTQDNDNWAV